MSTSNITTTAPRTPSMVGVDPLRENPIRAVAAASRANPVLTPEQQRVRDAGRRRVDALIASGHYSLAPRD